MNVLLKEKTIVLNGKQFIKCGRVSNEYGEFEMLTPANYSDLNLYFYKIKEQNGKIDYEEVEEDILAKLRAKYTIPKEHPKIIF